MREVSHEETLRRMRGASGNALRVWLNVGDPLNGLRKALNHFNLLSYQETALRNAPALFEDNEELRENAEVPSMPAS
jgi:hypothetical protein